MHSIFCPKEYGPIWLICYSVPVRPCSKPWVRIDRLFERFSGDGPQMDISTVIITTPEGIQWVEWPGPRRIPHNSPQPKTIMAFFSSCKFYAIISLLMIFIDEHISRLCIMMKTGERWGKLKMMLMMMMMIVHQGRVQCSLYNVLIGMWTQEDILAVAASCIMYNRDV